MPAETIADEVSAKSSSNGSTHKYELPADVSSLSPKARGWEPLEIRRKKRLGDKVVVVSGGLNGTVVHVNDGLWKGF